MMITRERAPFVELSKVGTGDHFEMIGVFLVGGDTLQCGDVVQLADDPDTEWCVMSVHRCVETGDSRYDHRDCFT